MPTNVPKKFVSVLLEPDFRLSDADSDHQTKVFQDMKVSELHELDERLVAELRRLEEAKLIHIQTRRNISRQIRSDA